MEATAKDVMARRHADARREIATAAMAAYVSTTRYAHRYTQDIALYAVAQADALIEALANPLRTN